MGLFLSYEKLWDMPLGGTSLDKEVPHWAGNLIYGVLFVICKICFRYRVEGLENLRGFKGKRGAVVVCNHTSFLDTVFLYLTARPKQWIRLMGRDSLFKNAGGLMAQALSRVGSFPVKRGSADRTSIKRAVRMLKNNEIVGIFPDGTRRGKGSLVPELHSGAGFIAKMGDAPLLPATVRDVERIKQKGKFVRFPKVTIAYGNPLLLADFDFIPKDKRLEAFTWYAMRECFALSMRCCREDVDMKVLYPNTEDFSECFRSHLVPVRTTAEITKESLSVCEKEVLA